MGEDLCVDVLLPSGTTMYPGTVEFTSVAQKCRVSGGTTVFRGIDERTHDVGTCSVGSIQDDDQASALIRYGLGEPAS